MIVCKTKEVNSAGVYVRYNLQDTNTGATKSYTTQELKMLLRRQPNFVVNLTFTRDGRIVDNAKVKAPRVIKEKKQAVNAKVLNMAKLMAYVIVSNEEAYEDKASRNAFIEAQTGKKVTSNSSINSLMTEAFYNLLMKQAYRYIGDIIGFCFSDPYWTKDRWAGNQKMFSAVKTIRDFGMRYGFSQEVCQNLTIFLM